MKSIIIGQYIPGKGLFYKLDPRTKIISVLLIMIAIFLLETTYQLLIALGIAIILLLIGRISLIKVIKGLKPIMILLIFTFIFQILLNKEEPIILQQEMYLTIYSAGFLVLAFIIWRVIARFLKWRFTLFFLFAIGVYFILAYVDFGYQLVQPFDFTIYQGGIETSIFVVIRLLIIITLSTVLTLTTKPTDLTQGIEKLLHPLKKIGFDSESFALIISISLRYIPTIFDEANKIMLAQASRGADFSEGKLKDKLKQVISLLVPMFIIAFMRSEELANAMESRNFVPGEKRTRINELKLSYRDTLATIFSVLILAASIVLKVVL
ncbi:MAG: energy-coupling factor transporter transmembrane component T [Candidatus Izemoplasmatales bacterium]|jgi:energy-coupling factor transport system permease protein|nr:energy-coupling factor transporter transmembrane component T [Candidatus Izemoplasmatales bacterium]